MPDERVLRQLTEALLFERIALWPSERYALYGGVDREIPFRVGPCSYRCRGRVGAFGRVRLVPGSVKKVTKRQLRATSWRELLEDVPAPTSSRSAVAAELESTVRLCRYNQDRLPELQRSRRDLPYEELERALHEGHPYHPCFKARTGFSLSDHARFGPEAGERFGLRWLLVRRASLHQALPVSETAHFRAELGEDALQALHRAWSAAPDRNAYGALPVHPWQWRALQSSPALGLALSRGELIDSGLETGRYHASQSLRTLLPASPSASHVKLPLAVRISSSLRTLEPETVKAAPSLSRWLNSLVAGDPFFERVAGAVVLAEHASSVYAPAAPELNELSPHLAVIWREPVARALRGEERAVPFNALFAVESDGRPYVDPWIERHGLVEWLSRLLRVTLLPLWRLLAHHGVALEAHAQNLVLLHEDGVPARLALRDFHDSLEYVPSFLAEPARAPSWSEIDPRFASARPGRHYEMSSLVQLRDLFIDAVLVFNLAELSWLLERHYGFAERDFWRLARTVWRWYEASGWNDPQRAAELRLFAPFVHTESLLKARIRSSRDVLFHHLVPNALHDHAEREIHAGHQ